MKWLEELEALRSSLNPDRTLWLTDSNVAELLPGPPAGVEVAVVPAGESSKSVEGLTGIWDALGRIGATRRSLLVNIGGGVVSDLGGFAAGTYKRGIRHVNVPTTLLAMADAAIGGKTGIDYNGLKNEAGLFKMPEDVIVDPSWMSTLSQELLRDGFAEVVKTAMLGSASVYGSLLAMPDRLDAGSLAEATRFAAAYKGEVVARDPAEKGLRRILNLGHTAGHAFESLSALTGHPVSHGTAVAHGLLVSLILSAELAGLDATAPGVYAGRILKRYYAPLADAALDGDKLLELMARDKKNTGCGEVSFILLRAMGDPVNDAAVIPSRAIRAALAEYRRLLRNVTNNRD